MSVFTKFVLVFSVCFGVSYAQSAKVVYDLTSGDSSKIGKHLINSVKALGKYYKDNKLLVRKAKNDGIVLTSTDPNMMLKIKRINEKIDQDT